MRDWRESDVQWVCVCVCGCGGVKEWGGGSSVSQQYKQKQQQTHAIVREIDKKPKYKSEQTKQSQNHLWNLKHGGVTRQRAAQVPHKTSAGPVSRCNITQSTPWHFEQLLISFFFVTTITTESSRAQASIKADGGITFHEIKSTALYLMPSVNRQPLFVSVNLFSSRRQSASRCWRPENRQASTGDNNRGTETFY